MCKSESYIDEMAESESVGWLLASLARMAPEVTPSERRLIDLLLRGDLDSEETFDEFLSILAETSPGYRWKNYYTGLGVFTVHNAIGPHGQLMIHREPPGMATVRAGSPA